MEHTFPTLVCDDINGNKKIWMGRVYSQDSVAYSEIQFGRQHGKLQRAVVQYTSGKNIGKSNETTPYEQCFMETERKWKNQIKKQYTILPEDIATTTVTAMADVATAEKDNDQKDNDQKDNDQKDNDQKDNDQKDSDPGPSETCAEKNPRILPMLAKTWTFPKTGAKPKKSDIAFPCFVQPKLDGLRCLVYLETDRIVCQSRTSGEFIGLDHITDQVRPYLEDHPSWVFDGELYTDEMPFEALAGLIKRKTQTDKSVQLKKVNYHVYDIYDHHYTDAPFAERMQWLSIFPPDDSYISSCVYSVETGLVETPDDVLAKFHAFIEDGHEGIMLRNADAPYIPNHRSHHLQKYKEFMEEEYPIVGFASGVGKYTDCVIWTCSYADGATFQVIPRGTVEQKREWFQHGNEHIGKKLTVIFQQKMESGCPRFPIGKAIREGY